MAATTSIGGWTHHSCKRHGSYAVRDTDPVECPRCRHAAKQAAYERAKRERDRSGAMTCDVCGTRLLRPAAKWLEDQRVIALASCNWCDESFDLEAALAAMDEEAA